MGMTNYTCYPGHRLCSDSCIIYFNNGRYSWCELYEKQKQYLLKSNYLEDAKQIDIKLSNRKVYELPIEKFIEWVKTGNLSEEYLRKAIIAKDEQGNEILCPCCGKKLVVLTARNGKNAGRKFLGCSGYPNCRHIESID